MINRTTHNIHDATLELAITFLMFDIFKMQDNGYVIFAINLGEYWNERVRDNPKNFPNAGQKRQKKNTTGQ